MTDETNNGNGGAEFKSALFSARLFGKDFQVRDFVAILSFGLLSVTAYAFWEHKDESRDYRAQMIVVLKELSSSGRAQAAAIRESNCLARFSNGGAITDALYERCRQISREPQ